MKIIDLLNKIANGEEIPKKIRVHYRVFEKYLNHNAYLNTEDEVNYKYLTDLPRLFDDDRDWLNDEVEILEEEKKIPEKLKTYKDRNNEIFLDDLCYKYKPVHKDSLSFNEQVIIDKLNRIIDFLKSKGE